MNEISKISTAVLILLAGAGLGALFLGGLWWTIRKGVTAKQPALWFSGSLFLRFTVVVGGFYCVGNNHYERFLLCLLGFIITGFVVVCFNRESRELATEPNQESGNAY